MNDLTKNNVPDKWPGQPLTVPMALALAILSGILWTLATPPVNQAWIAWIALVPMLYVIDRAPSPGRAALFGHVAGIIAMAGTFYWIVSLLHRFAELPWTLSILIFLINCAYQGSVFMLFAWAVAYIRRKRKIPMSLLAPVTMVTFELLVPWIFPGGLFITQAWHPLVLQISDLTGPPGVTALLAMINGAFYDLISNRRAGRVSALIAGLVLAAALGYGQFRMWQFDNAMASAPQLRVGVVQPNIAYRNDGKIPLKQAVQEIQLFQKQSRLLENAGAELIVWSEGGYPIVLPRWLTQDLAPTEALAIHQSFNTPVIIGTQIYGEPGHDPYNSALLFDRSGHVAGRYDKVRLLAFGEYIPGIDFFPWLRNWLPAGAGRFTAGAGPNILPFVQPDGTVLRLGPLICYEDILPAYVRSVARLHPHLLVNQTSDAWFGADAEPWQHLALAVFGSIEQRVSMVRAVNSGISAAIDANGRITNLTYAVDPYVERKPADNMLAKVSIIEGGHTVYAAVGNLFAYLCAVGCLLMLAFARWGNHDRELSQ